MPKSCEVVEMRNSADAVGYPCSKTASTQCSDCGSELCESHAETCGGCHAIFYLLPVLFVLPPNGTPEASLSGPRSSRTKKGLKLAELSCGCSGLFPVSQSHKLIQNFLQSLEPPFVVSGCPSISPVHTCGSLLISAISSRSFLTL